MDTGNPMRSIELALVSGKREPHLTDTSSDASKLVGMIIDGDFTGVLQSQFAKILFVRPESLGIVAQKGTEYLLNVPVAPSSDHAEAEMSLLTIGVAFLHCFLQENWTGPDLQLDPSDLFFSSPTENPSNDGATSTLNILALRELAYRGEPAYHLAKKAVFLRLSQIIFAQPFPHLITVPWWNLRATKIHTQILDEPVAPPSSVFNLLDELLSELGSEDGLRDLRGTIILERGLLYHILGNDREASLHFVQAAGIFGLQYLLTGALGKRTKFQQNDLSQLVLLAQGRLRLGENPIEFKDERSNFPATIPMNDDTLLEHTEFTSSQRKSDLGDGLLDYINPSSQPSLHPLDQSVLLAMCLNVHNTQPHHGLTTEQMSPYVERILTHPRNWSVYTMALLLRSRLEGTRTRTIERSTLQLQALIDQMPTSDSPVSERLLYIHSIPLPSKWQLDREMAIRYLSLGVVRSAMDIFERLEMWEEVVKCWQSMERPENGISIVHDLLHGRKEESETVLSRAKSRSRSRRAAMDTAREAKLWCLLGDLEPEYCYSHYTHAWEVSQDKSGRAARSLGGYHFARNEFSSAIEWLKKAVAINPLLSRTWFILGCACLREEQWADARDAFARCVTIDEDDGESWSNLASVYLRMGATGQLLEIADTDDRYPKEVPFPEMSLRSDRIPFENKMMAFRALKQGLKFSWENWRMWQNYMVVCMDVGELAEAARAVGRIVEERSEKEGDSAVDVDVLDRLVDGIVRPDANKNCEDAGAPDGVEMYNPNEGKALLPRVSDLFTRTILPRISSSPRIFQAYARLLTYQNRWGDALEAHISAYRCGTGTDDSVTTDMDRWREGVVEVEELVDIMRNLGPRVGSQDDHSKMTFESDGKKINWRFQARTIVRGFMGRTKAYFEEEPEWGRLQSLLDELKG
ncbi:uncharacterized protein EI90DRAFT_3292084 [Cantharellus anzutake]|uniref:uncharacterized protein n=1 Tax=Cantharellus anzutake TaxID=1750568 RepID=UPI001904D33D|nr:uncharacterized protein EI90DRAFT_3292084 [Cantharellus anzutake]KAF8324577.1 hypothetical protein EI90DRAFT_3292084 [Cantharellus anzutake]